MRPEVVYAPRNDENMWALLRCPKCHDAAWVDREQFEGKVSLDCATEDCDFHETHDMRTLA